MMPELWLFLAFAAWFFLCLPASASESGRKDDPLAGRITADSKDGRALDALRRKGSAAAKGSSSAVSRPMGTATFVIPRDTCQQGEPLQTLRFGKP